MLDVHFNTGGTNFKPENWPELKKAIDNKDWRAAAKETHRETKHKERNEQVYDKIMNWWIDKNRVRMD